MAHQQGDIIRAVDFNNIAANVNLYWGTGTGNLGLGQSSVTPTVSAGDIINHTEWASLRDHVNKMYLHQTHDLGNTLSLPVTGQILYYDQDLVDRIDLVKQSYGNTAVEGSDILATMSSSATWVIKATREAKVTFASGDAARYFFNSGGKLILDLNGASLAGNTKSLDWNGMFDQALSTVTLTGHGLGRSGTGYTVNTLLEDFSYYDLTSSYQTVISINNNTHISDYDNNRIEISLKSNGTNLSGNGDAGSEIFVKMEAFDLSTDPDTVQGTLSITFAARPPDVTYVTSSWGTPVVTQVTNTQS